MSRCDSYRFNRPLVNWHLAFQKIDDFLIYLCSSCREATWSEDRLAASDTDIVPCGLTHMVPVAGAIKDMGKN